MLLQSIREEIAEYGRKMLQLGLTRNTGGYISVCDRTENLIAITPSAMDYMAIRPENVIVATMDGKQVEGDGRLSTEWLVQQQIYQNRPEINAVVHTHSIFAITLSTLRREVPPANFTLCQVGGNVRCTELHNYTSQALADDVLEKLKDRYAVLMGNHGLVACGPTLKRAFDLAEEIEAGCEVYWRACCIGTPVCLSEEQKAEQLGELAKYFKIQR